MPLNTTEKQFESDIAAAMLSPVGGYTRNGDCYDPKLGLFVDTLIRFVQKTQPKSTLERNVKKDKRVLTLSM